MQTQIKILENLFYDKILLYQELVECLKEEREYLTEADMDILWEVSAKKQDIVLRIETIREKIIEMLSGVCIDHGMDLSSFSLSEALSFVPAQYRLQLRKLYLTLANLKEETRQRSLENKNFVKKSLDFLDELLGILTNASKDGTLYDGQGSLSGKSATNLLLHREV